MEGLVFVGNDESRREVEILGQICWRCAECVLKGLSVMSVESFFRIRWE